MNEESFRVRTPKNPSVRKSFLSSEDWEKYELNMKGKKSSKNDNSKFLASMAFLRKRRTIPPSGDTLTGRIMSRLKMAKGKPSRMCKRNNKNKKIEIVKTIVKRKKNRKMLTTQEKSNLLSLSSEDEVDSRPFSPIQKNDDTGNPHEGAEVFDEGEKQLEHIQNRNSENKHKFRLVPECLETPERQNGEDETDFRGQLPLSPTSNTGKNKTRTYPSHTGELPQIPLSQDNTDDHPGREGAVSVSGRDSVTERINQIDESHDSDNIGKNPVTRPNYHQNIPGIKSSETSSPETSNDETKSDKQRSSGLKNILILLSVLVLIISMIKARAGIRSIVFADEPEKRTEYDIVVSIKNLSSSYHNQDDSIWDHLRIGIESVKRQSKPAIFTLVHFGEERMASDIATEAGRIASAYLGEVKPKEPIVLSYGDLFNLEDHGELVDRYKDDLKERHSMVVSGVERIPGQIAQGLRYFCDEYNPLVGDSVILLTVNLEKCPNVNVQSFEKDNYPARMTEMCLQDIWRDDLDVNIIQPLLVRIVGIILKISPIA